MPFRDAPSFPPSVPASALHHSTELSRHDHHNLEIKSLVEPGTRSFESELDVFLFVPSQFQLSRWGTKELHDDFRPRLRLAIPTRADQGHAVLENARRLLEHTVESLRADRGDGSDVTTQLIEDCKEAGAAISETLNGMSTAHRREFLLAHALTNTPDASRRQLRDLLGIIEGTALLVQRLREAYLSVQPMADVHPILAMLDDFVSHLYVKYLATMRSTVDELCPLPEKFADKAHEEIAARFETLLSRLQLQEAEHRRQHLVPTDHEDLAEEHERRLVRLSQLKKFFQSRRFIEVTRDQPSRKFTESTAALGAACAGFWAVLCQRLARPELAEATTQGVLVISLGVLAYVLKDRIKERTKLAFHKKASQWLPDYSQELLADGKPIGAIREWFRLVKVKTLPETVRRLRGAACQSEAERVLPEDVIHFRKSQVITPPRPAGSAAIWALQENLRINVERYLKHMDDPFKELALLDGAGRLKSFRSRRVYHFYACVRTRLRPMTSSSPLSASPEHAASQFYRIVLDKQGIVRVEDAGALPYA